MPELRQRLEPLRSRAYLDGARGERCKLRISGVCTGDVETTVPCHVHDAHFGLAVKASDLSVIDGCFACHAKFDGRDGAPLSREEWLFYALRGVLETMDNRARREIVKVPLDQPKARRERKPKPRLPPDQRAKITGKREIPAGRPMAGTKASGFKRRFDGTLVQRNLKDGR